MLIDNKWKREIQSYNYIKEGRVVIRINEERLFRTALGVYTPEDWRNEET